MKLNELLIAARMLGASDMVMAGRAPVTCWVNGRMKIPDGFDKPLLPGEIERLFHPFLSEDQQTRVRQNGDLDWSASLADLVYSAEALDDLRTVHEPASKPKSDPGQADQQTAPVADGDLLAGRVRVNLHRQRGDWAAALRFIPSRVPPLETLNLPEPVAAWVDRPRGLVLVTGPTGSGKSTTLAAMIQRANQLHDYHVITLEDPIEYEFKNGTCLIEQRQIGQDSPSFADALRHVVRQRPDVILVGELRDRETIAAALTAAETGHLVLGSLHTNSAPGTIERIIDVFNPERQGQVRTQLAGSLACILCQNLLADQQAGGLIPATEVLIATTAVRRAIRDGQTHQIDGMLETGGAVGMHSLEQDLSRLLSLGRISLDDAMSLTSDPDKLNRRRQGGATSRQRGSPAAQGSGQIGDDR